MLVIISKVILILFGLFFMSVGILMGFWPKIARNVLRKAGSTFWIHYGEITIRMIPAAACVFYANYSKFPTFFEVFGWFMLGTSLVLYLVPKQLHHQFSNRCADVLKPIYFQCIAPISVAIGLFFIYSVW
jgi:hypothetical protein